jgi:uncharacterized membrane protein
MGETQTVSEAVEDLDRDIKGALSYSLGFITGFIFFVISDDTFVRFHAGQSILVFGGITVVAMLINITLLFFGFIPVFGDILQIALGSLLQILGLATLILWIFLMVQAYQNKKFELPIVGALAKGYE